MLDEALLAFVLNGLPAAPARVLEIGAGDGALAADLADRGYDLVAIDPASTNPRVQPVALADLAAPPASFDAAVAVLSLHHVEPLQASCSRLASVVRPGGQLVVDEFDIASFDEGAARWWASHGPAAETSEELDPAAIAAGLRAHLHPLELLLATLDPWFEFGEVERGPYLYRWKLPVGARTAEESAIRSGVVVPTGARVVGRRR